MSKTTGDNQFDIVPTHLAVQAMRDSGYKNCAYALAEIIDNSIQATATVVHILCAEKTQIVARNQRRRIHQIGVLDNGTGMDAATLRIALQFGNGTHLNDRSGIGRFGMGLPNASISQCKRVEVWSWQGGKPPIYTYLDMSEMRSRSMNAVPEPIIKAIPELWKISGQSFGPSGTLVVWTDLDRCVWKTASSILDNSQELIGRIYRRDIHSGKLKILLRSFDEESPDKVSDHPMLVNDPLFLMTPSCCPAPYDKKPMFEPWEDPAEVIIPYNGKNHKVTVRFSIATKESRAEDLAGGKPHGKIAGKNIGVSIIRANRELELDDSWAIGYNPAERWWGVEVEFPTDLDEIFGVTNDKQHARIFSGMAKLEFDKKSEDGNAFRKLKALYEEEDDPRALLLELTLLIQRNLSVIRGILKNQTKGMRQKRSERGLGSEGGKVDPALEAATIGVNKRKQEGHKGLSDDDENSTPEARTKELVEEFVVKGDSKEVAKERARMLVNSNYKFDIRMAPLEGPAFFTCARKAGFLILTLNSQHQAFDYFQGLVKNDDEDEDDIEAVRSNLRMALTGLELLLASWARYEDEAGLNQEAKERLETIRYYWGDIARDFMRNA